MPQTRDRSSTTTQASKHHAGRGGGTGGMWLTDAGLRRLGIYLHLQELFAQRDVVEAWAGRPDPRSWQTLAAKGARRVMVVAPSGAQTDAGGGDPRHGIVRAVGDLRHTGLPIACADVFLALDLDVASVEDCIVEARRVLRPDGVLVLGIASKDRPGATEGASYYELIDACSPGSAGRPAGLPAQRGFESVRMIGVAPFAGTTLVEYGVEDPEPVLDGSLVERGERVEYYLAIAGPERDLDFGYGVVQLPVEMVMSRAARPSEERGVTPPAAPAPAPAPTVAPAPAASPPSEESRIIVELRGALERHAAEMRARTTELAERDAYIAELEIDGRRVHELEGRVVDAERRCSAAEGREREALRTIAQLEGRLRTAGGGGGQGGGGGGGGPELAALQQKLNDAEAQIWKQMKARSEAEATATQLREENQRKLTDARKLASVELMRAMEEATRKAVGLREELDRCERERKSAREELATLKQGGEGAASEQAATRRELARAREEGQAAALAAQAETARALAQAESARLGAEAVAREAEARQAELGGRLQGLERALGVVERERDEARAQRSTERARGIELLTRWRAGDTLPAPGSDTLTGEIERAAGARGRDEAERERRLAEQNTELVKLRGALLERERRLEAIDRERPPRAEVDRQRAETEAARARVAELTLELQRRDAALERAAASAAHERARAERLVAEERQALAERNDARARVAEVGARVAGLETERERAEAMRAQSEERAHKAENEVKEKRERIRVLKRELEEAERKAEQAVARGRALETVRARVQALETAVAGEATRVADLEAALRGTP